MTPIKLQFRRVKDYEENARLLGKVLADHEGYPRDNDGSWILLDEAGRRVAAVTFRGKAKRGQAWNAPDPEGQELARRIVAAFNQQGGKDGD